MGAWVTYGLGSETENLPAFVVLPDPRGLPPGGVLNWGAGFLPAMHQGTVMEADRAKPPIADLFAAKEYAPKSEDASRHFLQKINQQHRQARPNDSLLEARISAYELAAKLQLSAPEAISLDRESQRLSMSMP